MKSSSAKQVQPGLADRGAPVSISPALALNGSVSRQRQFVAPVYVLLLFAAVPIRELGPSAVLWTAPSILLAAMLIAWAAESAQFFVALGFGIGRASGRGAV